LEDEGVLTLNKELEMPLLPQRIAVISSATAAGYDDFCHQLKHNDGGYAFYTELFPALMQGNQVEESVLAALDSIHARTDAFDVVVIIRGGGATSDLSGFDTYLLAAACAQFPLPIITGIGHERDETVLDAVSHTRVKTPTAAAELLIRQIAAAAEHLENIKARIPALVRQKIADARVALLLNRRDLSQAVRTSLTRSHHRLAMLQQRIADASPDMLLKRGYSITLKDGKAVTDANALAEGDQLITRFAQGSIASVVKDLCPKTPNTPLK
jgi:exodeoxyribonuclease VII large subunit